MDSKNQEQAIIVQITRKFKDIQTNLPELRKLVKSICKQIVGPEIRNTRFEISIAIVGDDEIRQLNSRFLNRDNSTDCLSFDLSDEQKSKEENRTSKIIELVVNGEMAARQAHSRGHEGLAELALYITHGLLHQFGFDDSTQARAKKMHDKEDEILQQLGFGIVYNTRTKNR
jgi:probable rRNA maturation factor